MSISKSTSNDSFSKILSGKTGAKALKTHPQCPSQPQPCTQRNLTRKPGETGSEEQAGSTHDEGQALRGAAVLWSLSWREPGEAKGWASGEVLQSGGPGGQRRVLEEMTVRRQVWGSEGRGGKTLGPWPHPRGAPAAAGAGVSWKPLQNSGGTRAPRKWASSPGESREPRPGQSGPSCGLLVRARACLGLTLTLRGPSSYLEVLVPPVPSFGS